MKCAVFSFSMRNGRTLALLINHTEVVYRRTRVELIFTGRSLRSSGASLGEEHRYGLDEIGLKYALCLLIFKTHLSLTRTTIVSSRTKR